ncbi:lycopene cyclase domain-containing protein [Salinigranum sp. GCM10025319]|uniref:lycopene cyclase domain-containing protein n=1 Tax=Salinigranum sp. GCM10025319 TaxID=3252687 RepID=UPI00360AD932
MSALTYLGFHAVFLLPPLVALTVAVARVRRRFDAREWRARWVGFAVLATVALAYTTPWDNYLIERGVWWYGENAVVATVWLAPVEEYLFMLLQPLVVVLWLALLASRSPSPPATVAVTRRQRLGGVLAGGVVLAVGLVCLLESRTYYLGAILAWAGPVLALQWGFGWPVLWATRRTLTLGVAVPTLYFWLADWVAIELGIWVHLGDVHDGTDAGRAARRGGGVLPRHEPVRGAGTPPVPVGGRAVGPAGYPSAVVTPREHRRSLCGPRPHPSDGRPTRPARAVVARTPNPTPSGTRPTVNS